MFDKIFWIGMSAPHHRGIGDHAQTLAIKKLLQKNYKDAEIIKIERSQTQKLFEHEVKKNDLILINSAGDFGDWVLHFHTWRRRIVKKFPENRIVQLPVTIHYSNMGQFELDKQVFGGHKNFLLMARDLISYDIVKNNFDCKTMFHPDFVFSLKPEFPERKRSGAISVLREDMEAHFNDKMYYFLRSHRKTSLLGKAYYHSVRKIFLRRGISKAEKAIKNISGKIFSGDIQMSPLDVTDDNREQMVMDTINFYKKFNVSVTDRFHGFVFSLIAKTPCVALIGGIPHKIKGYQSFFERQLMFVDSVKDIPAAINSVTESVEFENMTDFSDYFDNFKKIIEKSNTDKSPQNVLDKNSIFDIIKNRRTVRRWTKTRVEEKKLTTILKAGMYAPSAGNIQAVRFLPINNQNIISFICKNTCGWFKFNFPPVILAVLYDLEKAKKRGFDFTKKHKWSRFIWQDSSAAIENMLLVAKALGLESCWVSIPAKKQRFVNLKKYSNNEQKIRQILKISERYFLTSLVFVGYSDSCGNLKSRHQGAPIQRNFPEFVLNNKELNDFHF